MDKNSLNEVVIASSGPTDVFEVKKEESCCGNWTQTEGKMVDVDVVELAVTCAAAAIIMAALGILLFYFCTTRTQRQRCRKRCMNSRQSVEHVQSQRVPNS